MRNFWGEGGEWCCGENGDFVRGSCDATCGSFSAGVGGLST